MLNVLLLMALENIIPPIPSELVLTGAGSAYPYHKDPQDSHLRIAPTYPSLDEVETASELLCVCVRLAVVEKLLAEQA